MTQSRICPVCEKEVPEEARFLCPYCHFELKWLDDQREIERAKQSFTGEWTKPYDEDEKPSTQTQVVVGLLLIFFCLWVLGVYYMLDAF